MTRTDRQGNAMTGATAEAVDFFDAAVGAFNVYRGDPVWLLDRAIRAAPGFAMAHILKAHLFALATEPDATREAKGILMQVGALSMNEREESHAAALQMLVEGSWTDAAVALERHSACWPRDLVALQSGHLMDFYRASARSLRDRIARALPAWAPEVPGYPVVLGMHAFGLEETGDYARAGRFPCSRSIAGHTMRSPTSWRCRAGPRTASAG